MIQNNKIYYFTTIYIVIFLLIILGVFYFWRIQSFNKFISTVQNSQVDNSISKGDYKKKSIFDLANSRFEKKDFENARGLYYSITENKTVTKTQIAEAYNNLSLLSEEQYPDNLDEIKDYNQQAIDNDPGYAPAYVQKAKILFREAIFATNDKLKEDRIKSSFENLEKAISLYQNLTIAHIQLATQLHVLGKISQEKTILDSLPNIIKKDETLDQNSKNKFQEIVTNLKEKK
jgi:tetratricopeptide (TPR) repeat protein